MKVPLLLLCVAIATSSALHVFPDDFNDVHLVNFIETQRSRDVNVAPFLRALTDPLCPAYPVPTRLSMDEPALKEAFDYVSGNLSLGFDKMKPYGATGMMFAVTYLDDIVWSKSIGTISHESASAPTLDTIYRIGSVTKVFTTLIGYILNERKVIASLQDPISKYVPNFRVKNQYSTDKIDWRSCMSQMSGLPREAPCDLKIINCNMTTDEMLENIAELQLCHPIYAKPMYSNLAYSLIGNLFGKIRGTTWDDLFHSLITKPLGMTSTGNVYSPDVVAKMAVGYSGTEVAPLYDFMWNAPCGQSYSNARDLAKFVIANFIPLDNVNVKANVSHIITHSSAREMSRLAHINRDMQSGFATPFEVYFSNGYTIRMKGGNVDGYSAGIAFVPEVKLGAVFLINSGADEFTFIREAYKIMLPAFEKVLKSKPFSWPLPSQSTISFIQGYYAYIGTSDLVKLYYDAAANVLRFGAFALEFSGTISGPGRQEDFHMHMTDLSGLDCMSDELNAYDGTFALAYSQDKNAKHADYFIFSNFLVFQFIKSL